MMGEFSLAHILVVAVVALVLFGRGKVSSLMGEVGRGISAFKKGIGEGAATPLVAQSESQTPELIVAKSES